MTERPKRARMCRPVQGMNDRNCTGFFRNRAFGHAVVHPEPSHRSHAGASRGALTGRDVTLDPHSKHRPQDPQAMRAAIHELRSRGLGDHEIAGATAPSVEYVCRVLSEHQSQEVE
jgi:hypothetical protein